MAVTIQTPNGPVLMDETSGEILTEDTLRTIARQFALDAGIDPDIFERQIEAESGFNPNAFNPSGATGIAQIVPKWHPGVDANDPVASLKYAANLMASHLANYGGDYSLALAAYNAGPGAVEQYGGVPPFAETQNYIAKILGGGGGGGRPMSALGAEPTSGGINTPDSQDRNAETNALGAPYVIPGSGTASTSLGSANTSGGSLSGGDVVGLGNLAQRQAEAAQQGQQSAASLAEAQRQYNETMGYEKAKYNTNFVEGQRQFNESQDLTRGNTLLGLGSRPDTLIKYLYALRGQQTPQGLQNTTAGLPGYGNLVGRPNYGAGGAGTALGSPVAAPAPAAPSGVDPRVAATMQQVNTPGAPLGQFVAPGGTSISQQPGGFPPMPIQAGAAASATQAPTAEQLSAQDALIAQGRVPRFYSNGVAIFGDGGQIDEPFLGHGLFTGKPMMIGESGPETVVPEGKTLAEVKGKKGKTSSGATGFAGGGTMGYQLTPEQQAQMQSSIGASATWNAQQQPGVAPTTPAPGQANFAPPPAAVSQPQAFGGNPTQATTAMIGGVNTWAGGAYSGQPVGSTPANAGDLTPFLQNPQQGAAPAAPAAPGGVPPQVVAATPGPAPVMNWAGGFAPPSLFNPGADAIFGNTGGMFPQVGHFTGQGASLIPSAQKLSHSLGSERDFYSGFLQDEAGVVPADVFELTKKLGTQVTGLRTPRYAG